MIDNIFLANPEILSDNIIKEYLGLKEIKPQELSTINSLCEDLKKRFFYHHFFENYYLNYKIPQIGKEFDLLRIGEDVIVNIELKSEKLDNDKILKQLKRNYYYLSFLKKTIYCFTFVTDIDCNTLYFYNKESDAIQEINIDFLIDITH